jgi:hypothetical protein
MAPLVAWVTNWADDHWALAKVKRPSYQAWHCAGRQVLKVARFQGGVRITAGVNYSKDPPAGEEKALTRLVSHERPLPRAELAHIQARVTRAIWRRLAEQDRGDVEAWGWPNSHGSTPHGGEITGRGSSTSWDWTGRTGFT